MIATANPILAFHLLSPVVVQMPRARQAQPDTPWRSVAEVAVELGVHEETVRRWIRSGQLRGHKISGHIRIHRAALTAALPSLGPQPAQRRPGRQVGAQVKRKTDEGHHAQ